MRRSGTHWFAKAVSLCLKSEGGRNKVFNTRFTVHSASKFTSSCWIPTSSVFGRLLLLPLSCACDGWDSLITTRLPVTTTMMADASHGHEITHGFMCLYIQFVQASNSPFSLIIHNKCDFCLHRWWYCVQSALSFFPTLSLTLTSCKRELETDPLKL